MIASDSVLFQALRSHDPRFDGLFYVGVTTTRIYCRPVCTAKPPKPTNCRFFASRELAERAGFRPCLRCRPELAPGQAPLDAPARVAAMIASRIVVGKADGSNGIEQVARQFGWSSRQIRRIVQRELGVSPIELVQTRRLLLAKQLLTETRLPIGEVALASGFASLRRFNDCFLGRYRMSPTRFRSKTSDAEEAITSTTTLTLQLGYRPPFDWQAMLRFLETRAIAGVESVVGGRYRRTVHFAQEITGWIAVGQREDRNLLSVELTPSLAPMLPLLLSRLRHLFDLGARPELIASCLGSDPLLEPLLDQHPGLRVPGAFDGFELAVRAILGQQISVKAASTLAGRFAHTFGTSAVTPDPELRLHFPTAKKVAATEMNAIAAVGMTPSRANSIKALAIELSSGRLDLDCGVDPDRGIAHLMTLPGIGPWTAHYIAMRAFGWPDAFPPGDVVLRRKLGNLTPVATAARSAAWRPWRSYATLLLWQSTDSDSIPRTTVRRSQKCEPPTR